MYTRFCWGNLRERATLRHRLRWENNNNKMDHQEVGFGGMDWIDVAEVKESWRALVNAVMNFRVP